MLSDPVIYIVSVVAPLHTMVGAEAYTFGVGLTVIIKFCGVPVHPFADGVTVIVATIGLVVVSVAMNGYIVPVPLAANPIAVSLLTQL